MQDNKTNRVFFSACLTESYRSCAKAIKDALRENGIVVEKKIRNTKDIWVRDYMPIQIGENKFMRYTYRPDYLWKVDSNRQYITDNAICDFLTGKEIVDCNVVLDGGNVVVCGNKMILTEKVFAENADLQPFEITKWIEQASGKQVIWIPVDPHEVEEARRNNELPLCHADGILHAIDEGTILLFNYQDYDLDYRAKLLERLSPYFKIKEFGFGDKKSDNSWIYINYLQVGKVVLMPTLNEPADELAVEQLKEYLQVDTIVTIDSNELTFNAADHNVGGSLHCISWNVFDSTKEK